MASFAPIRGTRQQIENTPLVDGQFLVETDQGDQNKTYIDSLNNGTVQRTMCGGGGHEILPNPKDTTNPPTEDRVVTAVNAATATNEQIVSLYGTQNWTNTMTKRVVYNGTIPANATGIGTWIDDDTLEALRAMTVEEREDAEGSSGYGWWKDSHFLNLDQYESGGTTYTHDDYDLAFKFEPKANGDIITLGGYILDTETGRLCIKFGNRTTNANNRIAVDVTITRNNISTSA